MKLTQHMAEKWAAELLAKGEAWVGQHYGIQLKNGEVLWTREEFYQLLRDISRTGQTT